MPLSRRHRRQLVLKLPRATQEGHDAPLERVTLVERSGDVGPLAGSQASTQGVVVGAAEAIQLGPGVLEALGGVGLAARRLGDAERARNHRHARQLAPEPALATCLPPSLCVDVGGRL